jgi:hypothetical protein
MKYPKLTAAIDDELSSFVSENGIEGLFGLLMSLRQPASSPEGAKEKLPPIPVTKELVLSEQTEVRNGD